MSSGPPPARRRRARKACNPCHQRKRKCDGLHPCGMCTAYQYDCSYGDGPLVLQPPTTTATRPLINPPRSREYASAPTAAASVRINSTAGTTKSPAAVSDGQESSPHPGESAARAFPHLLSAALGDSPHSSGTPPKTHSVAFNFGTRPEEPSNPHDPLSSLISEKDLNSFSDVYFSSMAPIIDVIDPKVYAQRCHDYYHDQGSALVIFGAIAAGVAALGSFLHPTARHPRESDLAQYAKAILDDPASISGLGVDQIVAWALRVVYLRATSRPEIAFIASCTALHLIEALGLHDEATIQQLASSSAAQAAGHDVDRLRRIFWISWSGHTILSYEYDRSPVHFRSVTCEAVRAVPGSAADLFIQMAQIIPSRNSPFQLDAALSPREDLSERIRALETLPISQQPFLVLTKADLAFCFYRRIYQLQMGIPADIAQLILDSGNAAVRAAEQLSTLGRLFWNVIGSVFHYVCVLLALDSPAASAHIGTALEGLEKLARAADTSLTREALSMAQHLVSLTVAKKQKELAQLEAVQATYRPAAPSETQRVEEEGPSEEVADSFLPDMEWDANWDHFVIDPYLSMLGPDTHF